MKKKFIALLGVILCVVVFVSTLVACSEDEVDDVIEIKPETTIEVKTADDLISAGQYVGVEYSRYTIKLMNDIDLTGKQWKPIGLTLNKAFMGVFDGNNKEITGLKITGWDEDGNPEYIAKRILGWVDNTPIYSSSEILAVNEGEAYAENQNVVNSIIREGDNADPNYEKIEENGKFETNCAYGSVGLFGYTKNAKIKNLTVKDADISFYSSGEYTYAGVISGYDNASEFNAITIDNCKIAISTIYEQKVTYHDYYGTPKGVANELKVTQYVGGIIGYAKSGRNLTDSTLISTKLTNVNSNSLCIDNTNYSAYYNGGLTIVGDKDQSKLVHDISIEDGYEVIDVENKIRKGIVGLDCYPVQVCVGAIAGYLDGAQISKATVDGLNPASYKDTTNELKDATLLIGRSIYGAGAFGCLYNSSCDEVLAENVYLNTVAWKKWNNSNGIGLVYDKATVGGIVALVGNSEISNSTAKTLYFEIGGNDSLSTVCVGGIAGYAYNNTNIAKVEVDKMFAYSDYTGGGSEELSSIIAGAVGVLRDSKVSEASVTNIGAELYGHRAIDNIYIKGIVSQMYGDASLVDSFASSVVTYLDRITTSDYSDVQPVQYKNNYVNDEGYASVQLYYSDEDRNYSGVYVTVYANAVPVDENGNVLYKEYVYVSVDISNSYNVGDYLPLDTYYYYNETTNGYNFISTDTTDANKKYVDQRLYATRKTVYRVELSAENVGKAISAGQYYEYDKEKGNFSLTKDSKFASNKTYYIIYDINKISSYNLNVTVYTESGNVLVVNRNSIENEDDDVLAEAVYKLTKEEYDSAVRTVLCGTITYELAEAEIFFDKYFDEGTGFIKDSNEFIIKYYDTNITNRDFSKYILVDGRPEIEDIEYR